MSPVFSYGDGVIKRICMKQAALERKKFSRLLTSGGLDIQVKGENSDFDVISFSGQNDFEEQVLSICSFIFRIGKPNTWTVYSDGTYTEREKHYLIRNFPFVKVKVWDNNDSLKDNKYLKSYLETCHLSKKLHAIIGHNYERQTIYTDSDIVFYENASAYFDTDILKNNFWYIVDTCWGSFRKKNISKRKEMFSLNSGLLILNESFNFRKIFEYLESLNFRFEYFSEQSSFDYAFKSQNAGVLDPRQFVVDTEDQFTFSNAFQANEIALRHYVNPVRHKIWQKGWRWHFQ